MLADFFEYDFLRHTFLTGILIGLIAPLLGTFIVVRRLSLIADALSHVTLAGIAFGLFLDKKFAIAWITPFYGGMIFSVIGSILIEKLRGVYKAFQELAIPIILSGGVGLSVIFISLAMVSIQIYLIICLVLFLLLAEMTFLPYWVFLFLYSSLSDFFIKNFLRFHLTRNMQLFLAFMQNGYICSSSF